MNRININNKKYKRFLIEYIIALLIIELIIILVNIGTIFQEPKSTIVTEISKINTINMNNRKFYK